jgi:two-component system OmpR family response regulator/two-component system response regulator RstA
LGLSEKKRQKALEIILMNSEANELPHIMVVEDDESLAAWIADYLNSQGYQVSVATRGDDALELIKTDEPDLLVLDVMLPGLTGLEVCEQARKFYTQPILMLTAQSEEEDEIRGLETGADDFLPKPVKPKVLLARIKALLRREQSDDQNSIIRIGGLYIDPTSRTLTLDNSDVPLSSHEFDLLTILASHAGTPVSRENLVSQMRGIEYDGLDRSIDISISRLRKKLGDVASAPERIKTIRGKGYLLAPDAW